MPKAKITYDVLSDELGPREESALEACDDRIRGYADGEGGVNFSYMQDFVGDCIDAHFIRNLIGEVSQLRKLLREEKLKSTVWHM